MTRKFFLVGFLFFCFSTIAISQPTQINISAAPVQISAASNIVTLSPVFLLASQSITFQSSGPGVSTLTVAFTPAGIAVSSFSASIGALNLPCLVMAGAAECSVAGVTLPQATVNPSTALIIQATLDVSNVNFSIGQQGFVDVGFLFTSGVFINQNRFAIFTVTDNNSRSPFTRAGFEFSVVGFGFETFLQVRNVGSQSTSINIIFTYDDGSTSSTAFGTLCSGCAMRTALSPFVIGASSKTAVFPRIAIQASQPIKALIAVTGGGSTNIIFPQ